MNTRVDLKAKPFYLSDADIEWVVRTISRMSTEERIGQLFCPLGATSDRAGLSRLLAAGIGGMMFQPGHPAQEIREVHAYLQENSAVPLLLAANTEAGGVGIAAEGTNFGKPLQVAATGDDETAYRLGYVSCAESAAVGCNWSFAPVVDIDRNFHNPIANVRTFGDDPARVLRMGLAYLRGADEAGAAVSIKHFPGDGSDERDQHLHVTCNGLSAEEWSATYGMVYKGLIAAGAKTVMVGHISQPAWAGKINPALSDKAAALTPATLSGELLQGLLRRECGFNGMIVSDATSMLGFTCAMPRRQAVPACIAAGVDMFLFNKDLAEDSEFMLQGLRDGVLTEERLREALERILGLKASLGLHRKQAEGTLVPGREALGILGCERFRRWGAECADRSVTLVKDTAGLLPISPEKHRRILLLTMESAGRAGDTEGLRERLRAELEKAGFEVCGPVNAGAPTSVAQLRERYDLALYAFNLQTASNNTVVRLNWKAYPDCGMPWFIQEIPTLAVSFANPYHLFDMPQAKTYINAYTANEFVIPAVVEKITGRSPFKGASPVDPFCGLETARY